ncbi:MAG: hypothetical protein AAF363_17140 [Bacteroidota bacterium]
MMLAIVLANLQLYFGMPIHILNWLAPGAGCFAIYSFSCFLFLEEKWQPFLKVIAMANKCYCLVTLFLIILFWNTLTMLGIVYFLREIILVMTLVSFEWKKAK